jgi:hypothetical protein
MNLIIYRSGISGGTATLSFRLGKELVNRGYNVFYILERNNDISNYNLFVKHGIKVFFRKDFIKNHLDLVKGETNLIALTFTPKEQCFIRCKLKSLNIKVFCYCISNGISGEPMNTLDRMNLLGKLITKLFFKDSYKKGYIFFTSENSENRYLNFYKAKKNSNSIYSKLPINVECFDINVVKQRYFQPIKRIISFFRSEFPLKGYVFPLIDSFSKIIDCGIKDVELVLITFGEQFKQVEDKVKNDKNNSFIKIIHGCSYENLQGYLIDSYLDVGHGTSILDSGAVSLPSLVSVDLTYDNICCGFFDDVRLTTGARQKAEFDYYYWIRASLAMSLNEYIGRSEKTFNIIKENYSISTFLDNLLTRNNLAIKKTNAFIDKLYYIRVLIRRFIYNIFVRRNKK